MYEGGGVWGHAHQGTQEAEANDSQVMRPNLHVLVEANVKAG